MLMQFYGYTVDDKAVDGKSFNVGETVTGQLAE